MEWTIHSTVPFPMLEAPETVPLLAAGGVGPEIYFSGSVLDSMSPGRAERAAASLRDAGIDSCTFHAPFEDLWPGARDERVRKLAEERIGQAIALAHAYRPKGIVVHGGYFEWLFDFDAARWFECARRTFGEIAERAEKAGVDLFLENVFDEIPDHLLRLHAAVGSKRLGFCCDAGHATLFSRIPVQKWVEAFGPHLKEMHIHDNRGLRDDHLPAGEGSINFRGVLLAAADAGARPILTVEPHRREHFPRAIAALRRILGEISGSL